MAIVLAHANRRRSNHTSWSQIEIFERFLNTVLDVDTKLCDASDISVSNRDILMIFGPGYIDESIVSASYFAKKVILQVPDLCWDLHLHAKTGSRLHRVDAIVHSFSKVHRLQDVVTMSSGKDNKLWQNAHNFYIPFGALTLFDRVYEQDLREFMYELISDQVGDIADSNVYFGSWKEDRMATLLEEIGDEPLVMIGNMDPDNELLDGKDNVRLTGWVPPASGEQIYKRAGHSIICTDFMNSYGLDYNRPYEMARAGANIRVLGPYADVLIEQYGTTNEEILQHGRQVYHDLVNSGKMERLFA